MLRIRAIAIVLCTLTCCEQDEPLFGTREFLSESLEGRELVPDTRLSLQFHGSELAGYAGCNNISGRYRLADGRLVTGGLFRTEKGCGSTLGDIPGQEDWFVEFLGARPHYQLDEPRLVLSDDDVTVVFLDREVAVPDRPLESSLWAVNGLVGSLVFSAQHDGDATLQLVDGRATIVTPCARGSARYEIDDDTLTLRDVAIDEPACPADEFSPYYDDHMRDVLTEGALDWEVDAARLTLMRGDVGLMFRTE